MPDVVREARQELMRVGLRGEVRAEGVVPDLILRSWRRSIGNSVDTAGLSQRYQDIDTESILCRAAAPVLDRWQHQLADTGATVFLSDSTGNIVSRRAADSSVLRRLDSVHAAEGFDYSEDSVGTNGLGTSMIERRAVYVEGSQHYNDALSALACAAAPVCTPAGSVLGSVSVGGPIEVANPMMLSLTLEIGHQIEERLRSSARPQDLALAMSFMRFRNSGRPTVVMDHESILVNTPGLPYVSVNSHVTLWELLNAHDWSSGDTARLSLDGAASEVLARRVAGGPRAHFVLHFSSPGERGASRTEPTRHVLGPAPALEATDSGLTIVEGPRGSGRATVAEELHTNRGSAGAGLEAVTVAPGPTTPWGQIADLLAEGTDVLVRRGENVPEHEARQLVQLVTQHRAAVSAGQRTSTLLLTACREQACAAVRTLVDETGPAERTVALARAPERIPGLVKQVLSRVDPDGRHALTPAALQAFVQWSWPGNVAELSDTLAAVVSGAQAPVIQRRHLPQHLRQAPPRRRLTPLETAEREAILRALNIAGGNKSEAAATLGIGRTTLYRRLRQLGINADERSL